MSGCGCDSGFLAFVKPPYAKLFCPACCLHANAYDIGGGKAERKRADCELYYNILRIIAAKKFKVIKSAWLPAIALLYYIAVRCFGSLYFKHKTL